MSLIPATSTSIWTSLGLDRLALLRELRTDAAPIGNVQQHVQSGRRHVGEIGPCHHLERGTEDRARRVT